MIRWLAPGLALALSSGSLTTSAPAAPSQSAPDERDFQSGVELVVVDVAVVDKQGEAISGLGRDDFLVTDEGNPQTITSFEAVVVPRRAPDAEAEAPSRPSSYSTNRVPESRRGRTFLVVFDDIHLSPAQAFRAKGAVAEFLRTGVASGDRVTLIATGGGAWWNARMPEGRDQLLAILRRLDGRYIPDSSPDRITEYEAMRIEEFQDIQVADKVQRRFDSYGAVNSQRDPRGVKPPDAYAGAGVGIMPELIRSRAQEVHNLATSRNRITLRVMTRAIEGLSGTRGRKSMILVSQGFVYDVQVEEMRKVVEASTRANVPIYFIDTRGLQGLPEAFTAAFGRPLEAQDTVAVLADITLDAEGAVSLADDTGGFAVRNTNDLSGGITRVSNESRTYYLLGYTPSDLVPDGKFHKIEVKLRGSGRKGLAVRARRGYYAPRGSEPGPEAGPARSLDMVRAADSPLEVRDVPLRVAAFVFDERMLNQMSVTLAAEIDVRDFAFREGDGLFKDSLALLVEAQHRETGEYYRYDQTIEMSLLPATHEQLRRDWYQVLRELSLPPGGYQVRVVAKDVNSGRMGTVTHEFEVPPAGHLRVSTPILSDVLDEADGGVKRPVLRVRRTVAPGSILYCQFSVYGAERDEGGSLMPDVTAGYEIRRPGGSVLKTGAPTRINPTSLGALSRLSGIALPIAPPGDYDLVLRVRDEIAGREVVIEEPFVIAND